MCYPHHGGDEYTDESRKRDETYEPCHTAWMWIQLSSDPTYRHSQHETDEGATDDQQRSRHAVVVAQRRAGVNGTRSARAAGSISRDAASFDADR